MKVLLRMPVAVACLLCVPAAHALAASANGTATIVVAISITKDAGGDLKFGNVVASGSAGTVVMSTSSVRSATGGVTLGNAGTKAAAHFTVSGDATATYAITLPSSATITTGTDDMTVDTFTSSPSSTGTLSSGTQALNVGATLHVAASQPTGTYSGTFDVTVAYN